MGTVIFFDTSLGTFNHGDDIIMQSIYREFEPILKNSFRLNFATHLVNYTSRFIDLAKVQSCSSTKLKFICGTDILWPNPLDQIKVGQLQFSSVVKKPNIYSDSILLGAGIKIVDRMKTDLRNKKIYNSVLSKDFTHSVRDEQARAFLSSLGFKVINTGCPTLWMLKEDFCKEIPHDKAENCIFSLTSEKKNVELDKTIFDIIKENYSKIYFWVQRWNDDEYLRTLGDCSKIEFIYDLKDYDQLLNSSERLDYIGTRLHGGIFALQHKRRSIIIAIDHRALGMFEENQIPGIDRNQFMALPGKIQSSFETKIKLNTDGIETFVKQFT